MVKSRNETDAEYDGFGKKGAGFIPTDVLFQSQIRTEPKTTACPIEITHLRHGEG